MNNEDHVGLQCRNVHQPGSGKDAGCCKSTGQGLQDLGCGAGRDPERTGNFDVLLLGPQVRHILRRVTKLVGDQAVVDVIDGPSYGRCDGAAVLKQAEDLYAGK